MIVSIQSCFETLSVSLFGQDFKHLATSFVPHKHAQVDKIDFLFNEIVESNNITLRDVKQIVTANGPGSFTGIRIGLAFTEGIACFSEMQKVFINNMQACLAGVVLSGANFENIAIILPSIRGESYIQLFNKTLNPLTQIINIDNKLIDDYLSEEEKRLKINISLALLEEGDIKANLPNSYNLIRALQLGLRDDNMISSNINYVRDAIRVK
jgi:tRNA threonylcarbamoyl adenosine modification protein YeaZ